MRFSRSSVIRALTAIVARSKSSGMFRVSDEDRQGLDSANVGAAQAARRILQAVQNGRGALSRRAFEALLTECQFEAERMANRIFNSRNGYSQCRNQSLLVWQAYGYYHRARTMLSAVEWELDHPEAP
jgi:hypothetical protein